MIKIRFDSTDMWNQLLAIVIATELVSSHVSVLSSKGMYMDELCDLCEGNDDTRTVLPYSVL